MNHTDEITALHNVHFFWGNSGWLTYALKIIQLRDHLEPTEETQLATHVDVLKQYLDENGISCSQRLFLETACFIPGSRRGIHPPLVVLQPNRGGFSLARLKEAAGWVEHCEAVITNLYRLSEDRLERILNYTKLSKPDNLNDPRQTIDLILNMTGDWTIRSIQQTLRDLYQHISLDDAQVTANYALRLLQNKLEMDCEIALEILEYLVVYHPVVLQAHHAALLSLDVFYPGYLYRDALPETSSRIIHILNTVNERDTDHLLLLNLAWSGTQLAQTQFGMWKDTPPDWWEKIYEEYPLEAGWEITTSGQRRNLYFQQCYALVSNPNPGETRVFVPREDTCPWCHQPLENVFSLDLTDVRLNFLGIDGTKLNILTCSSCLPWSVIFGKVDYAGNATWSAFNPSDPPMRSTEYFALSNTLTLANEPRNPFEAQLCEYGQSQVGGFPTWVNDADYPICPDCGQRMVFIGQIQTCDIEPGEGCTYGFLCKSCQLTATFYDQT